MKYNNDEEACRKKEGCTYTGADRTKYVNGKCVGMERLLCLPVKNPGQCESIDDYYCKNNTDGTIEWLITSYECDFNLGEGWKHGGCGGNSNSLNCYQTQEICYALKDEDSCLENYCAWVSKGYKAIIEDNKCTGWDPTPINGCFSLNLNFEYDADAINSPMWRTYDTNDGTIMMKITAYEYSIKTSGEDPSQIYCYEGDPNPSEICNCPDPPE